MQRHVEIREESWPLRAPFTITGKTWRELNAIVVELGEGEFVGWGEAAGIYYLAETVDSMIAQIRSVNADLTAGMTRIELLDALPPGGARNAIDCAMWDLEAKLRGRSVWEIAGVRYAPVQTVMTIPILESAKEMGQAAQRLCTYPVLKVKLDSRQPVERLTAIRTARPDATIVVDANEGFSFELLKDVLPAMSRLNIAMIEQPLPRGEDDCLEGFASPVPLCADESCLHEGELAEAAARYRMINIKLDKCGGLTAALRLAKQAQALDLPLMIGNMIGTSLAMFPGLVVAQQCHFVDLDGPLHLKADRPGGLLYESGKVSLPADPCWGNAKRGRT